MDVFKQKTCFVVTKHAKEQVILPPLKKVLGLDGKGFYLDTDIFGTFCGKKPRIHTPLECAKQKCLSAASLNHHLTNLCFVSSEGSFGPHPTYPIVNCDHELLYFYDPTTSFSFSVSEYFFETHILRKLFEHLEDFLTEAAIWKFPSHGILLRPHIPTENHILFKNIASFEELTSSFESCQKASLDKKVIIESDMQASFNPTRMANIGKLAEKLARKLYQCCPRCSWPGWDVVAYQDYLHCERCFTQTKLGKYELSLCQQCLYEEIKPRQDGLIKADPRYCLFCNP